MLTSFRTRILLTFFFVSLALMGILGVSHYQTIRQFTMESFEGNGRTITRQIAQRSVIGIFSENLEQLAGIASDAFLVPNLACLCFFDDKESLLQHFQAGPQSPEEETSSFSLSLSPQLIQGSKRFFFSAPVVLEELTIEGETAKSPGKTIGYVVAGFTLSGIRLELISVIWNFIFSQIIIALVFGFLVIFLERWVTKPLVQLIEKVKTIAGGDLSARVDAGSPGDDIGDLGQNINLMAGSLQSHTHGLEAIIARKTGEIEVRERQMMFQDKMASLGRMSANIAHEINNPLNYVSLGIDFLDLREEKLRKTKGKSFEEDSAERQKVFADIRHGFKRMRAIVDALRKFSRTDESQIQEYSFQEAFEDALRIFHLEIKKIGVVLERNFSLSGSGKICGSPVRMQQILLNLFSNSLDAFEEKKITGPVIRVEAQEIDGKFQILFQDNGPGISLENQSRIFEPFFTTKPPGKGTGIGLALCFELVAREGGTIKMVPSKLGGATFAIILPKKD